MFRKALERLAAPVSHTVLSLLFMYHIGTVSIGPSVLVLWIVLMLVVNGLLLMLTAKGRWYASLATVGIYILLLMAFTVIRMAVVHEPDWSADYYGIATTQLFIGLPVSLGCVVLGSLLGQLLSHLLQSDLERLFPGKSNRQLDS